MYCTTSRFLSAKMRVNSWHQSVCIFFIVSYPVQLSVRAHSRSSSFFFSLNALSAFPFSRLPFNFPICVQSCLSTEHCQVCFSRLPSVSILACCLSTGPVCFSSFQIAGNSLLLIWLPCPIINWLTAGCDLAGPHLDTDQAQSLLTIWLTVCFLPDSDCFLLSGTQLASPWLTACFFSGWQPYFSLVYSLFPNWLIVCFLPGSQPASHLAHSLLPIWLESCFLPDHNLVPVWGHNQLPTSFRVCFPPSSRLAPFCITSWSQLIPSWQISFFLLLYIKT
jgi:hypothetical protein